MIKSDEDPIRRGEFLFGGWRDPSGFPQSLKDTYDASNRTAHCEAVVKHSTLVAAQLNEATSPVLEVI